MGGLIPPGDLERIRGANDIVEIVGGYIPLKRAGTNFVALCPFHKEKSPSFNVNPSRQIFHCFGCQKGGDVFGFVMAYENISFVEAAKRLAERAHLPISWEQGEGAAQSRFLKENLLKIHEQITHRWQNALATDAAGQIARDYLAKRGVSQEAIQLFRLGYAPDAWDDTLNWSRSKGYSVDLVEQAGLVIKAQTENRHYDRFRGRLMFPICDEQGRVIGFSGRVLAGDEKVAKYVNSPETPIFTKGKVMFGLDKSRRAILDAGAAIVCEGQLDLIAIYMAGVQHVVAPQGTAFTADHARILKRYTNEVVLCFDSDNAGQKATRRVQDELIASELAIRVAQLPASHDPDSFIKAFGPERFREIILKARGFFDYLLDALCQEHDSTTENGRAAIVRELAESAYKTNNAVIVDTCAQKVAQRLDVGTDAVRTEFKRIRNRMRQGPTKATESTPTVEDEAPPAPPQPAEAWILKILLLDDTLVDWAREHLAPRWIRHPLVRSIVETRFAAARDGWWHGVASLLSQMTDAPQEVQRLITEAVAEKRELPNRPEVLRDSVRTLRDQELDTQIRALERSFANPELLTDERTALMHRHAHLRELRKSPLGPLGDEEMS